MGAVSESIRRAAESFGAVIRTDAPVERILTSGGRVTGVALRSGEELSAPIVVAATHPQLTFLRQLDPGVLPDDFLARMRHWRSRSGTVKVNLALSELPDFVADPGTGLQSHHTGAIELAHSLEYLETAFQEARSGQPATSPFSDGCIPSTFDRTICPEGSHIMSLFTQWVPAEWAAEPHQEELEAYADRVVDAYTELAPNLKRSIIHRQVIGPHEMEDTYGLIGGNIFHGELSVDQLFHNRPAAGYADFRSPVEGLYQAHSATHGGGGVCGSLVGRLHEPCWPTAVRRAGGGRGGRWRDAPAARSCRRRGAAGGAAALRAEPHAARAAYVDEAVLAWERQWFFDDGWVCAGRVAELAEPGDQRAVKVGSTGVLVVRGADGELRAFANICRHRGHELLACGASANRGVIQCPYHAWSYELDGHLRLAPRFDGAETSTPRSSRWRRCGPSSGAAGSSSTCRVTRRPSRRCWARWPTWSRPTSATAWCRRRRTPTPSRPTGSFPTRTTRSATTAR